MRMERIAQAHAGKRLISQNGLVGRLTPYIEINNRNEYHIPASSIITIVETPRRYQGCGRSVKFTVGDNLVHHYAWWKRFKECTHLER